MRVHTAQTQASITPSEALEILKKGNQRFVNNLKINRNLLAQVNETKNGQFPFAIVLSCIDSRTSAELIFDQGLGDIFSARIAGNILNKDILGSMEYACKIAGSKLIVILGHSKCGAIKAACTDSSLGHLTGLLEKLKVSVNEVKTKMPELDSSGPEFTKTVEQQNIQHTLDAVLEESPVLKCLFDAGEIGIIGAYYDVDTGQVDFLEEVLSKKQPAYIK